MSRKRKGDWRLPTIEELLALYDEHSQSDKEMENKIYWSSTTLAFYTSLAWVVGFGIGRAGYRNKTDTTYVRCVRNTKNGLEWSKVASEKMTWYEAFEYVEDMNKEIV